MTAALTAGLAYFGIVFGVGFLLGSVRILVLAPRFGEAVAVLIELPIILLISWLVCRRLVNRFAVAQRPAELLAMGGSAFALLMAAEMGVSLLALGGSVSDHLAAYRSLGPALGLAGQIGFAVFPLLQTRRNPAG